MTLKWGVKLVILGHLGNHFRAFLALCRALSCPQPSKKSMDACKGKQLSIWLKWKPRYSHVVFYHYILCFLIIWFKIGTTTMRKWCFTNDQKISIVTVAMAICSVNTNMKCTKYELVLKQYKFLPIFDWHLQSYLFFNNTDVHKTKNCSLPSPR